MARRVINICKTGHLWNKKYQLMLFVPFFHLLIFRDKQSVLTWMHRYCVASQINLFLIYSGNSVHIKNLLVLIHFVPTLLTSGSILLQLTLPASQYNIPASASTNLKSKKKITFQAQYYDLTVLRSLCVACCTCSWNYSYWLISPVDPDQKQRLSNEEADAEVFVDGVAVTLQPTEEAKCEDADK